MCYRCINKFMKIAYVQYGFAEVVARYAQYGFTDVFAKLNTDSS